MDEKARLAALRIESRYLEQAQRSSLEKKRLEMEEDRLEMEKEIAIAEAKAHIYDEHAEGDEEGVDRIKGNSPIVSKQVQFSSPDVPVQKNNDVTVRVPPAQDSNTPVQKNNDVTARDPPTQDNNTQLSHLNDLCSLLKLQGAPNVDMDYFDGNPLDFHYFKSLFEELIEKKIDDPLGKLARLIKYTRGEPKKLIQHCIQMPQPDGYNMAMELLQKEYGDPHKVSSAYMKELRSWKPIPSGDVKELKKYYRFLLKCNTNRKGDMYLKLLDNPETLRVLQSKLPYKMRERWTRRAVQQRETGKGELVFSDFIELVRMECKFLDDPVYSLLPDSGDRDKADDKNKRKYGGHIEDDKNRRKFGGPIEKNFASLVKESDQEVQLHDACLYCADRHDIDSCPKFTQLSHRERRGYLFKQKICFYCYEVFVSSDHGYNKCKNRRFCTICKEPHPTALHNEQSTPSEEPAAEVETSRATRTDDDESTSIGMPVIPVRLYVSDNPKNSVIVYAMLDVCSTGTFILQETVDQLNEESQGVTVLVRTIIGRQRGRKNFIRKNRLVVESVSTSLRREPVSLPKCCCGEDLPVEHDEIITIGGLKKWSYLHRIEKEIENYKDNIPIALIIGGNCPKVHEPWDCIPSQDGGPFATLTNLGWCVVGPFRRKQSETITCHRISVRDVSTNEPSKHSFVLKEPTIKDVSIVEQLQEMYMHDFNEKDSEKKGLSVEDTKFLEIMQQHGKLDGKYHCLPLPFRNEIPNLPYNKMMAAKRLKSIKSKMCRDDAYRDNYTAFMGNILAKGFARKVDKTKPVPKGKVWFFCHHGVYHPKTGKFRVVMDCSAEYHGRSLNAELLQGPDSTNRLLGVLLRFRQHDVPFMGDLEQMFFQIRVPEEHISFQRFLWWPDGNLEGEPEEYEMCVHLFGAISSPSVAGYALRKTATDCIMTHGEAAVNAVLRNFYVDDFCKSERSDDEASNMIRDVDSVCATRGFNLTKMVSSSRQVLNNIPVEKREKDCQNHDL